jgi:ABC-type uncharacterized transport system fused permease/ATPase subunit
VLDECTSAVSIDVEARLYESAARAGIATITLSQRLALEEFHTQELRLGANNSQGWELLDISASAEAPKVTHTTLISSEGSAAVT